MLRQCGVRARVRVYGDVRNVFVCVCKSKEGFVVARASTDALLTLSAGAGTTRLQACRT